MSEVRLQVKNLCKNFGITKAVQNVSFNVNKGEVHALIGEQYRKRNIYSGRKRDSSKEPGRSKQRRSIHYCAGTWNSVRTYCCREYFPWT